MSGSRVYKIKTKIKRTFLQTNERTFNQGSKGIRDVGRYSYVLKFLYTQLKLTNNKSLETSVIITAQCPHPP